MSNPFDDQLFKYFWDDESNYNTSRRKEILSENPPTIEQIVDFVIDVKIDKDIINKLYFIYRLREISDKIGWETEPSEYGIGGYLKSYFYEKILKKLGTDARDSLFSYLPDDLQTDDRLLSYLSNTTNPSLKNYHNDKISPKVLEWVIDNKLKLINDFKKEWWTPKLKTKAIEKNPDAIAFIPENLLTKAEIKNYLKNNQKSSSRFMETFWKLIPDSFKNDSEIFSLWLYNIGDLKDQYPNIKDKEYYNIENVKKYFEMANGRNLKRSWDVIESDWKKDKELINLAIPVTAGAVAIDTEVDLTDDIIERTTAGVLPNEMRARVAIRLLNENRLTKELVEKLRLDYWGIDGLMTKDITQLLSDDNVLDHLIKNRDSDFLARKTNWPKSKPIKREHIVDIILTIDGASTKSKTRFKGMSEDDWLWAYFDMIERKRTGKITKDEYDTVSWSLNHQAVNKIFTIDKPKELLTLVKDMGDETTYDSYKAAQDIFIF